MLCLKAIMYDIFLCIFCDMSMREIENTCIPLFANSSPAHICTKTCDAILFLEKLICQMFPTLKLSKPQSFYICKSNALHYKNSKCNKNQLISS